MSDVRDAVLKAWRERHPGVLHPNPDIAIMDLQEQLAAQRERADRAEKLEAHERDVADKALAGAIEAQARAAEVEKERDEARDTARATHDGAMAAIDGWERKCDAAQARAAEMERALEAALRLIGEARGGQHGPWCNGVHADNGACEGAYLAGSLIDRLEALLSPSPSERPAAEEPERQGAAKSDPHYGRDCPKGMVQVEFVGCSPLARMSDYGWKPTESAFLEVWVDGKRFRIDVGDFHDGNAQRRGLHIITDVLGIGIEKTSMNAASLFLTEPACARPASKGATEGER